MKSKDLQSLSAKELEEKLADLDLELIKSGAGQGSNAKSVGNIKETKKTIARIKTRLRTMEAQIKA